MMYEKSGSNSQNNELGSGDEEDDVVKGWLSTTTESPYFASGSSNSNTFKSYKGKRKRTFRAKNTRTKRAKKWVFKKNCFSHYTTYKYYVGNKNISYTLSSNPVTVLVLIVFFLCLLSDL